MSSGRSPFSSLSSSLEQLKKGAEETVSNVASSAKSTYDRTKSKLQESTQSQPLPTDDFRSENPWACSDTMFIRVTEMLRDLIRDLPDPRQDEIQMQSDAAAAEAADREAKSIPLYQERFVQCERAYARLVAVERDVLYPLINRATTDHKLDESLPLTVELLLQDHLYFDSIFATLGKGYRNPNIITSQAFRQALQALVEAINIHHQRESAASKVIERYFNEADRAQIRAKMIEVYQNVPRTPFTQSGSIVGKVGDALSRVSNLFKP